MNCEWWWQLTENMDFVIFAEQNWLNFFPAFVLLQIYIWIIHTNSTRYNWLKVVYWISINLLSPYFVAIIKWFPNFFSGFFYNLSLGSVCDTNPSYVTGVGYSKAYRLICFFHQKFLWPIIAHMYDLFCYLTHRK